MNEFLLLIGTIFISFISIGILSEVGKSEFKGGKIKKYFAFIICCTFNFMMYIYFEDTYIHWKKTEWSVYKFFNTITLVLGLSIMTAMLNIGWMLYLQKDGEK